MAPKRGVGDGAAARVGKRPRAAAAAASGSSLPDPDLTSLRLWIIAINVILFIRRLRRRSTDDSAPISPSQIGSLGTELGQISCRLGTFARKLHNMDRESSRHNKRGSKLQDLNLEQMSVPLDDLKRFTKNFSDARLIGEGGFGKVYKGVLENGSMIAVKKVTSVIEKRHFENEAYHLMGLNHPNIVKLVGYCSETETIPTMYEGKIVNAERSENLLCLEYLPNGCLRSHLSDESTGLDWDIRYKIIKGICNGLHYLHEEWLTPIIHMDLKPENILLDDNMVPKIADFGLSRLFGKEKTRTVTTCIKGTFGYMAPEYINRGIITKQLDIFSLGVIIIQIVTGHKVDYPDEGETLSQEYMKRILNKWRHRMDEAPRELECCQIKRCIEIALDCVKPERTKRPTIGKIIEMLPGEDNITGHSTDHHGHERLGEGPNQERASAEAEELVTTEGAGKSTVQDAQFCVFEKKGAGKSTCTRLRFLDCRMRSPACQRKEIKSDSNGPIKIGIFDGNVMIKSGPLSEAKVEIVALEGSFPYDASDSWTDKEFNKHIARGRDGEFGVLEGEGTTVKLMKGEGILRQIRFREGSYWAPKGMFIVGARVCDSQVIGDRVQEAVMNPVVVVDSRNECNQKRHPPNLDDGVYRLETIAIYGEFHKRLKKEKIFTVEHFLKALHKDKDNLARILNINKKCKYWDKMVKHAQECCLEGKRELKSYRCAETSVVLFFNCVHNIVGAKFGGVYITCDMFSPLQQTLVDQWIKHACDQLDDLNEDYVMMDNIPMPI